ncbi:MAG: hypothetical protein ACRC1H_04340 [Caldilineaceae bacterium]
MPLFQQIWNVLLNLETLGAERDNPVALSILLVAGLAALFAGRRLLWLVAAVVGYVIGSLLAPLLVGPIPILGGVLALGAAVIMGLLAAAALPITARLVTFLAASLLALLVVTTFLPAGWAPFAAAAAIGILTVLLLNVAYDEVLIVLSAFYGAVAVLGATSRLFGTGRWLQNGLLFAILMVAGMVTQWILLRRDRLNPLVIPISAGGIQPRARRARRRFRRGRSAQAPANVPPEVIGLPPLPPLPPTVAPAEEAPSAPPAPSPTVEVAHD